MNPVRATALTGIALTTLMATACGDATTGATSAPAATSAASGGPAVTISGSSFQPTPLAVHVNQQVTFTNKDGFNHTATSDAGAPAAFDSHELGQDASFPFTFAVAGKYTYHCSIHASMTGEIDVT